jgi:hypothetical protein
VSQAATFERKREWDFLGPNQFAQKQRAGIHLLQINWKYAHSQNTINLSKKMLKKGTKSSSLNGIVD